MATKRRRRELRDLRSPGYTFPEAPDNQGWAQPPDKDLQQLAAKHGFKDPVAVQKRLNWIYEWWRGSVQIAKHPEPTGSERREFFDELKCRAEALLDALNKLDGEANRAIYDAAKYLHNGQSLDLRQLAHPLKLLERAADSARANTHVSRAGARLDAPLKELLYKLWEIYSDEFGPNAPRISNNAGKYRGKFFSFAWDATRVVGIGKQNSPLGKAIEVVLGMWDLRHERAI